MLIRHDDDSPKCIRKIRSPRETQGLALLFADDERSLQELMKLEIPRMGHRVTVCPDGLTAAAALEKENFDCILVDLDMPGLNGIEVIAKAKELSPDIEAIVLTGKSSLDTAIAALRHGAFDYLTKPCKLVEIEALLEPRAGEAPADAEISCAQAPAGADRRHAAARRHVGRHGQGPHAGYESRADAIDRADSRRDGHRQGARGPGRPRAKPAGRDAVRGRQLRCAARDADRKRAVRPSQRLVHRRRRAPRRPVRSRRTAARSSSTKSASCPRRCRPSCCACWRAARFAASARTSRSMVDVRVGLRHASRLARDGRRGRVPRGPGLPHQHVRDLLAAAARSHRRHCRNRHALAQPLPAEGRARRARADARRDRSCSSRTFGRATSASWPTRSSMPRSSATTARSRPNICRPNSAAAS